MKLTLDILERYRKRKAAYQVTYRSGAGADVLAELAKFCCAFETTVNPRDRDRDAWIMEGRRQVYLRIMKHLNFTTEELAAHYEAYMQVEN